MKMIGRCLALIMMVGALVGITAPASNATTGNIQAQASCPTGDTWSALMTWNSTDVPSNVYAEVKAISTTAGTLVTTPGQGVMSGNQVILAAFPDHVNNYPGVKTHKGNWSDKFTVINIPKSVNSITVMVQYDYSNGHSDDPTKTVTKPSNCNTPPPYVLKEESQEHDVVGAPDCDAGTVTTTHEKRTRRETAKDVWGEWSAWTAVGTPVVREATAEECPPPPPPPVVHVYDHGTDKQFREIKTGGTCRQMQIVLRMQERSMDWTSVDGVKTYGAWSAWKTTSTVYPRSQMRKDCVKKVVPRIIVIDNCRCKDDHVKAKVKASALAFQSVRQDKFIFTVRLVAKPGFLFPKDFKHPGKGWAHSVKYVVHTTNTKCPCPPGKKHCTARPTPPPLPPCRICA